MNTSTSNLIKFIDGSSAKEIIAPEIDTPSNVIDFTKYGSNIKALTTSGGKTIGYYTDTNGVIQLTELDSTSTSPVNVKTALKVVESENGYKFQGIKETTGGLSGSTIVSGVLGGVGVATTLNQFGIHIGKTFYGDDVSKWPQLLKDQKLLADTVNMWNCNFERSLVQEVVDGAKNTHSSVRDSELLSDSIASQGVLPLLFDVSTNQAYAPEEMITDLLGAIASVWKLGELTDLPTDELGTFSSIPTAHTLITYNNNFSSRNIEHNDCVTIAFMVENAETVITCSTNPSATLSYDRYNGETYQFHRDITLGNESHITKNGLTTYYYVWGTTGVSDLPKGSYTGTPSQGDVNAYGSWYTCCSDPQLPTGTSTIDGETTLGIGDFMRLERMNQDEKHSFLTNKFPSWFSNAIQSFYIDPDTYEKVGQWLWPFSPTGKYEEVTSPNNTPWEMPNTENVPQSADGKAPLDQLENVLETVVDAMKGIVFNFDFDPITLPSIPNQTVEKPPKTPPQDTDPVEKPNRTGDGSTPLVVVPEITGDTGLGGVYNCSNTELGLINQYLWSSSFWAIVEKMITNPMDAIIGLHQVYFTPTHSASKTDVYCGCQNTHVQSYKVTQRFYEIDCGHVKIQEHFANVYDYDGTEISIYLPYVGIVPLDVDNVMRGEITVKYNIDICSGSAVCNISVSRDGYNAILYSYGCNVASIYPLSGRDFTGLVNAVVNTGIGVGTGNTVHAISGAIGIVGNSRGQVQKSGGYGGNTGALGVKKPYLIINRCIPNNPTKYNMYRGYATNKTLSLSNCSGYTEVENIRLDTTDMLYEDILVIENMLNNGVVL